MSTAYDFRTLSPLDFEGLVHDALEASWNLRLEAFGPGRDQGIDLRHICGGQSIIIQAKHFVDSGYSALKSALKLEIPKIQKLKPTRYVLATSVPLTPHRKAELISILNGIPLSHSDIFGQHDLNAILRANPKIVQNHFKLWLTSASVLDRILNSQLYNRTEAEIDIIRTVIPRFVQNKSVEESLAKLENIGTLIIAGPPGVGKTTLARILLWLHAEQGWSIHVVDSLDDAFRIADTRERRLIMLDDFLGQVQLSPDHVRGVDARLPPLINRVSTHNNLRFVLTTRDYILSQAKTLSAKISSDKINAREYVLNVGTYTRDARARILYNHIYFSTLNSKQKAEILQNEYYLQIIDHKNFNPRIIDELTSSEYYHLTNQSIRLTFQEVLANPALLWERPFRQHISEDGRTLMFALALNTPSTTIEKLKATFLRIARALGKPIHPAEFEARFRSAFKELDGSIMSLVYGVIVFSNPGIVDFVRAVIISDKLIRVFLREIQTPSEIRSLWSVYSPGKYSTKELEIDAELWKASINRGAASNCVNVFDAVSICVVFAEYFDSCQIYKEVHNALDQLDQYTCDDTDITSVCVLLEQSRDCSLPLELEARFQSVITRVAASLLNTYKEELSLEDLQSLEESLHSYGSSKEIADQASQEVKNWIHRNVRYEAEAAQSIEELDELAENMIEFLRKRGFSTEYVSYKIDERRDDLAEEGKYERSAGYISNGFREASNSTSNSEIISMFRGLS